MHDAARPTPSPHPDSGRRSSPLARLALALALVAGVGLSAACKPGGAGGGAPDAGPVLVGPENVATARKERIEAGPRLAGTLQAKDQAVMRAEVGGSVTDVKVELGEAVKAGQVLARIEANALGDVHASAQAAARAAESDLQMATRQLQRTEKLVQGGALSERDLEVARSAASTAEARLSEARARLTTASKQLGDTTVRAPFDGVVSERKVNTGDVVAPGAALFTVIDPGVMRVEAAFPSEQLPLLRVGAPVQFEVRGYPGQTFEGAIERIAPAADPATRQIPVLVGIPNPGGKLVAGLFAEGRVAAEAREGVVVPASAVDEAGGTVTVRRIRNGVVEAVPVEIGLRDERAERIEISKGLAEGDLVLTGSARDLTAGSPVQVREAVGGGGADAGA